MIKLTTDYTDFHERTLINMEPEKFVVELSDRTKVFLMEKLNKC